MAAIALSTPANNSDAVLAAQRLYDAFAARDPVPSGGDRVTAVGTYRGTARATGEPVEAAFAHILTIRDGRISELRQITDTVRWTPATQ